MGTCGHVEPEAGEGKKESGLDPFETPLALQSWIPSQESPRREIAF